MKGECRRGRAVDLTLALALTLLVGCGQKIQQTYVLGVVGPTDEFYLKGASTIVLEVNGREISRNSITEGLAFSVGGDGVDVSGANGMGSIKLRALDGAGNLVAYGQTPSMELALINLQLGIFVQRPGTLATSAQQLLPSLRNLIAVAPGATPNPASGLSLTVPVPLFGLGVQKTGDSPQTLGDGLSFYNVFHPEVTGAIGTAGSAGTVGGLRQYRRDAAALVGKDGKIYVFGGLASSMPDLTTVKPTSELDTLLVNRNSLDDFRLTVVDARASNIAEVARSGATLAESDSIYAFGGQGSVGELDTVVALHPAANDANGAFELLNLKMGAPRLGHSATPTVSDILVFGGDQAAAAVAEVLTPPLSSGLKPTFVRPAGDAGSARWNHGAVKLSGERVLIVGGRGPNGPLGDSVLYLGLERRVQAGAITLKTPRSDFAAFTVGSDLVVAGGVGADGKPLADAEIYDVSKDNMPLRGTTPCRPRYHAAVSVLENSVVVIGGSELGPDLAEIPSSTIEIYQPYQ